MADGGWRKESPHSGLPPSVISRQSSLRSEPSMFREIDGYAVRAGELDLDVAALGHVLDAGVGAVHRAGLLDARFRARHVLDLEPEVVHAGVARSALGGRGVIAFEPQYGHVHVSVGQVVAFRGLGIELADLLQAQSF